MTIEIIQCKVCQAYRVKPQTLRGKRKWYALVLPRHIAMFLSRKLTGKTLQEIARAFGRKDHGTVIHAVKSIEARMGFEPSLKDVVMMLEKNLKEESA